MPEKFSSIENVYGKGLSEAGKANILRGMEATFNDQRFGDLKGLERDKLSWESQTTSFVNEATNNLRNKYGLEDFNIPEKNVHIIEKEQQELVPEEGKEELEAAELAGVVKKEEK